MISVVIEAGSDDQALARTLSALVQAAAEGFVRDVVVAVAQENERVLAVADAMGCVLVTGDSRVAVAATRGSHVLMLLAGARVEIGWHREAGDFLERFAGPGREDCAAALRLSIDNFGWSARIAEALARFLPPKRGLLASREALLAARRLRIKRLRARLFVN